MSKKLFQELLNDTFDNGTVHIKYLEQVIKCISNELNLGEMEVENTFECQNSTKNDPLAKLISPLVNPGPKTKENSIVDIIQLLNISKRIEALEISVQKISSVMHNIMASECLDTAEIESNETITQQSDIPESNLQPSTTNSSKTEESVVDEIKFDMNTICDDKVSRLEERLAKQECSLMSIINQNNNYQNQICEIKKSFKCVEEKLKDLIYACEQNDEKIEDAILSINNCNSTIFCLKPNVSKLLQDSEKLFENFNMLSETCEKLNATKAEQSYLEDTVLNKFEYITDMLREITKFEEYLKEECCIEIKMMEIEKSLEKFQNDFKTALLFLKSQIDEKLEKKVIGDFKECVRKKFNEFLDELKEILGQFPTKAIANGTTNAMMQDLKCISCKCNVCMKSDLQKSISNHQISTQKGAPLHKRKEKSENETNRTSKKLLPKFPLTQQCFIISKDNSIYKADPMKCLLNPHLSLI